MSTLDFEIPGYDIIEAIGRGGMSSVYRARQHTFDRNVAVKILNPDLIEDDAFCQRFLMESLIVAKLNHSNIVQVYDVGEIQNHYFIAMEFLSGGDLHTKLQKGIPTNEAVAIIKQMASALDFAHRKHIIHRDLKPENVMFREDGAAVLTDFGIAKETNADINLTQTGLIVGTPKYMSPEQIIGAEPSPERDIYSLGIMFYQLLTNRVPFDGSDLMSTAYMHFNEPVPQLPPTLARFQTLIENMLAKEVGDRISSGNDVIKAIDQLENNRQKNYLNNNATVVIDALKVPPVGQNDQAHIKPSKLKTLINRAVARPAKLKPEWKDQVAALVPAKSDSKEKTQIESTQTSNSYKRVLTLKLSGLSLVVAIVVLTLMYWSVPERVPDPIPELVPELVASPTVLDLESIENIARINSEITQLLNAAADDVANLRLQKGQSNALTKYQKILAIEPNNPEALAGIQRIKQTYLDLVESSLTEGRTKKAQRYLIDLQSLAPEIPILALQQRLDLAKQRQLTQKNSLSSLQLMQISALLKGAELNISEGRIRTPKNDNAVDKYNKVLSIDPSNVEAKNKLADLSG